MAEEQIIQRKYWTFGNNTSDKVEAFMKALLKDIPLEKHEDAAKKAIEIIIKERNNGFYFAEDEFKIE